eukprot:m51a1_g3889 hypothetical protein (181) ;mRNA; r:62336-63000
MSVKQVSVPAARIAEPAPERWWRCLAETNAMGYLTVALLYTLVLVASVILSKGLDTALPSSTPRAAFLEISGSLPWIVCAIGVHTVVTVMLSLEEWQNRFAHAVVLLGICEILVEMTGLTARLAPDIVWDRVIEPHRTFLSALLSGIVVTVVDNIKEPAQAVALKRPADIAGSASRRHEE